MGLDQKLFSIPHKSTNTPVEQSFKELDQLEVSELGYWRKANHIHGYMEELYRSKGGTAEDFNCVSVQLTKEELTELLYLVTANKLKPTVGFFFGGDNRPEGLDTHSIRIICNALDDIVYNNKDVYYDSWW